MILDFDDMTPNKSLEPTAAGHVSRTRTKKILLGFGGVIVVYFALYFVSVGTTMWEGKATIIPEPVYRPFDGGFVRAVFTPAHLIDAAYFRRAHWEPRNRV